jgi:hypothetical protein
VTEHDLGVQPIDALLTSWEKSNADVVSVSTKQLTHKMVQKARKGRRLTSHIQYKILSAMNALKPDAGLTLKDLFNY